MTEPSTTETKIEQIVKGIDGLSEEDYTSTGIPRVESLEAITGITEITGDERDEAWVKYQAENPAKEPESPEAAEAGEGDNVQAAAEVPYVVAEGKAITSRKGILGPGEGVFPLYFGANGAAIIKKLEEDGMVVAT